MKKFLGLLMVLFMTLSIVSLPVYAVVDESVQAVYDVLTEEMLTTDNEPAVSVTKNLNTDLSEDISLPNGVSVSFVSSDQSVVTDDGTVNRPLVDRAHVAFTATISKSGSDSLTKQLNFTVLPQTETVLASENFYYPSLVNHDIISWDNINNQARTAMPSWTVSNATAAVLSNDITAKLLRDSNGCYNVTTTRTNTGNYANVTYLQYRASTLPAVIQQESDRFVTLTMNLNPVTWGNTGTRQFYIMIDGQDASGTKTIANLQFWGDRIRICDSAQQERFMTQGHAVSANRDYKIEVKLDYENKLVYLYLNDQLLTPGGVPMTETDYVRQLNSVSIGYFRQMTGPVMQVNDFTLATEKNSSEVINAMTNTDKANYFAGRIGENTVTAEKAYLIENNLSLTAPYADFDLAAMGVNIQWESSEPSVISPTGLVSRQANNRCVVMKAIVTAGNGADAVTVTKEFHFTVGVRNASVYGSYNYDFESDIIGSVPRSWTINTNSTSVTTQAPGRDGKALQATFTGNGTALTATAYAGALNKSYFISADVNFNTNDPKTGAYFVLQGADVVAKIGMRFSNGSVLVIQDGAEKEYMVPGVAVQPNCWYHIDIDFNAARKSYTAYINGRKIFDEPIDIADDLWTAWLHIRQVGLAFDGAGVGYVDHVVIRESDGYAPVYDANSDYTVRSISLSNQNGKTITDIAPATTKVVARVKLLENRTVQNENSKIFFTRYNTKGMLEDIVSQSIATNNKGLIAKLEMPLTGDCTGHTLKAFVMNADTLVPICSDFSTAAPKFEAERLFAAAPHATKARELGYEAESDYEGIEAIFYDGDTYKGRHVKHFAYFGLPEGASAEHPVPAVVCVHGGGGSAYDEWVKKWNDAGYAAIAMNLNGRVPSKTIVNGNNQLRHAWPGATQDNYGVVSSNDETWMYSAVTAVIAAHNVLRAMPEIDNDKIGITGVSWGGVVTSTVIGVDNRFAFAIPSYGCGFLYDSETYMANCMTQEKKSWDPSNFIKNADLPILWMNGDRDGNFSLTSTTKSAALAGEHSTVSIIPNFSHDHSATWNRPECYAFADSVVKNGMDLIKGRVEVNGLQATAITSRNAVSATMYYSTDDKLSYQNGTSANFSFVPLDNSVSDSNTFTFTIPSAAKRFYIVFKDEKGYNTSTTLIELER